MTHPPCIARHETICREIGKTYSLFYPSPYYEVQPSLKTEAGHNRSLEVVIIKAWSWSYDHNRWLNMDSEMISHPQKKSGWRVFLKVAFYSSPPESSNWSSQLRVQRYEIFSIIPHYRPGIYWCARRIPSTSSLCGIPEYSGGCREVFKKVKR